VTRPGQAEPSKPSASKAWLRALEQTATIADRPERTFPVVIDERAVALGDAPALLSDGGCLTYRELTERSNRYARWAMGQGVAKGDVVCLLMPNCPEYLAIWLGVTRAGGVVALLNTLLKGPSLAHCIALAAPRLFIVAAGMVGMLTEALSLSPVPGQVWVHGTGDGSFPRVDLEVENHAGKRLSDAECALPHVEDRALYIYTSGTTGLPKAAIVSHFRVMQWSHWFAGMMDTRPSDRMYDCLPMYHSVGGVLAPGAVLVGGGAVVIRESFSAREFWSDVARWDCTLFQYIGELCRYLLRAAPVLLDTQHRLRLCCGNGLRSDVWMDFKTRFKIPQILEFYAATEGNISLYNVEGKPGAIGRVPSYLAHRFPIALARFDFDREVPARDARGLCVRCAPDEVGEAIGRISAGPTDSGTRFEGYTSKDASDGKVLHDVFETGDAWFRTGDLMRRDEQGFYYFVDRIGDTFRWKGENVSTVEVSRVLCEFPGISEAVVYGVAIPGAEGRAGMAAVIADGELDFPGLQAFLVARLPAYARPLFLRRLKTVAVTATFKHSKQALVREGYDPAATPDSIYFADTEHEALVPLDRDLYARIRDGGLRV